MFACGMAKAPCTIVTLRSKELHIFQCRSSLLHCQLHSSLQFNTLVKITQAAYI